MIGFLTVQPATVQGLAPDLRPFVGFYIVDTEKHRTNHASGPDYRWTDALRCTVPSERGQLTIELINEDEKRPGVLGKAHLDLHPFLQPTEKPREQWVEVHDQQNRRICQLLLLLGFHPSGAAPGQAPPNQAAFASLGPKAPMPENYGKVPVPMPPSAQHVDPAMADKQKKGGLNSNVLKYGGMALAGATVIGATAYGIHEIHKHHERHDEEEARLRHESIERQEKLLRQEEAPHYTHSNNPNPSGHAPPPPAGMSRSHVDRQVRVSGPDSKWQ